jgi:hypothetical protein
MGGISGEVITLFLGAITIVFWRQIGFAASWSQERAWRYPKGALTTGRPLLGTQLVFLFLGIVMVVTTLMSMA